MAECITDFGIRFGSFLMLYDKKSVKFLQSTKHLVSKKLKWNTRFVILLVLCALVTILRHKQSGNFARYIMAATYSIAVLVIAMIFSIFKWFGDDIILIANYMNGLFRQIERKYNLKINLIKFKNCLNFIIIFR